MGLSWSPPKCAPSALNCVPGHMFTWHPQWVKDGSWVGKWISFVLMALWTFQRHLATGHNVKVTSLLQEILAPQMRALVGNPRTCDLKFCSLKPRGYDGDRGGCERGPSTVSRVSPKVSCMEKFCWLCSDRCPTTPGTFLGEVTG